MPYGVGARLFLFPKRSLPGFSLARRGGGSRCEHASLQHAFQRGRVVRRDVGQLRQEPPHGEPERERGGCHARGGQVSEDWENMVLSRTDQYIIETADVERVGQLHAHVKYVRETDLCLCASLA